MADQFYGLPPRDDQASEPSSAATLAMVAGLVLMAAAFLVVGFGLGLGWFGPLADDDEPVDEVADEDPPEPRDEDEGEGEDQAAPALPGAEAVPVVAARPAAGGLEAIALLETEPVPEVAPRGGTGLGTGTGAGTGDEAAGAGRTASASAGPRVSVAFDLGHYDHVEIKLGGKRFVLDGGRTIKLRPGGYRVELRKDADAPWRPAGLAEFELGSRYRVTLFDPPLAKVEVVQ